MQTGIGIADATELTERVIEAGATGLISIGTAGGLAPDVRAGALLIPGCIRNIDGEKFFADAPWHARVHAALKNTERVHTGDLLTVNHVVRRPDEKHSLHKMTKAVGLDMESSGLAEIAVQAGLPFLVLRVVMDTVFDKIPNAAIIAVSQTGDMRIMATLGYLARHPSDLPGMLRILRRYRSAAVSLRGACRLARKELMCPV